MYEFLNKGLTYNTLNEYQKHKADWIEKIETSKKTKKAYWIHLNSKVNDIEIDNKKDLYEWDNQEIIDLLINTATKSDTRFRAISLYIADACEKGLSYSNPCDSIDINELIIRESYNTLEEFYDFLLTLDCTDVDRAMITLLRYGANVDNVGLIKWEDINEHDKILNINEKDNVKQLPIDDEFIIVINRAKSCMNKSYKNREVDYNDMGYVVKPTSNVKWKHASATVVYNTIEKLSTKSGIDRIDVRSLGNARIYDLLFEKKNKDGSVTNEDIIKVLTLIQDNSMATKTNVDNSPKVNEFRKRFEAISDIIVDKLKRGRKVDEIAISKHESGVNEQDNSNNNFVDSEEIKGIIDDFNKIDLESNDIEEKYRNDFVKIRIGQGKFRDALIKKHGCKCDICGLDIAELLIASHIKEYACCINNEHIDLKNGLLLCANHDKLFDRHLISFNSDGRIMFSESINTNNYEKLNIKKDTTIDKDLFKEEYMSYHREKIV